MNHNSNTAKERVSSVHDTIGQMASGRQLDAVTHNKGRSSAINQNEHKYLSYRNTCSIKYQPSRIRNANNHHHHHQHHHKPWYYEVRDGFLQLSDGFRFTVRQCPRQTYHVVERLTRLPEANADEFGIVSKRALPEHYYMNTGYHTRTSNVKLAPPPPPHSSTRMHPIRRDMTAAILDFSHPRCFANPENNIRLLPFLDPDMESDGDKIVAPSTNSNTSAVDTEEERRQLTKNHSRTIRFDFDPQIIELLPEEESEGSDEIESS
jgi:hypothetical protein